MPSMKAFMLAFAMMLSQSGCTLWVRNVIKNNTSYAQSYDPRSYECLIGWKPACK